MAALKELGEQKRQGRRRIDMSYQTLATALCKYYDIHEGHWRVGLNFGTVTAANVNIVGRVLPAAFIPVMGVVLLQDDGNNQLSVDAAVVNPRKRIIETPEITIQ